MEGWLKQSRVIGLDALELANFPVIGRGVRTLQHFKPFALCSHPCLLMASWLCIFFLSDRASQDTTACEAI
ncbi:putative histone-lysine N-methyltransferase [Histoplasma ohiense]|nr:putative histone-lysine N-methyltransferase [Histoplasma ohiense (nom. inval.)]